jgi:hypothetical protein
VQRTPLVAWPGLVLAVLIPTIASAQRADDPPAPKAAANELVYADFEKADNGRAVSTRGGPIIVTSYQESDVHKTTTKGAPGAPDTPELVHVKAGDPNHLGKIEFGFMAPNNWAGASIEIKGRADVDGKPVSDDVSGYKKITFQLYATGAEMIRVQAVSRGGASDTQVAWPQMSFKVRPGLNTYEVAIKSLIWPDWAPTKDDPKKILAKLTGLNITAFCEPCRPVQGILIVDNVTFEK